MLYQLNYIHHVWDCKCTDYFRFCKIYFVSLRTNEKLYGKT